MADLKSKIEALEKLVATAQTAESEAVAELRKVRGQLKEANSHIDAQAALMKESSDLHTETLKLLNAKLGELDALRAAPAASGLSLEILLAQFMEAKDSGVVKALHAFMAALVENYHDGPGAPGRAAFQLFEAFANPNDELYKGLSVMERQGATTMASSLKQAFRVG